MTALEIKAEILRLIDLENDPEILDAIRTLLKKKGNTENSRYLIESRILKAEEDIEQGNTYTMEEAREALRKHKEGWK